MTDSMPIKCPKKLIEVGLPLEKINAEALRRKQKAPKGWPTSFHKWWAQRPIAAARAVLFAQVVNDPSWRWELDNHGRIPPNHLKASWAKERARLFRIIEELCLWDNSNNQDLLNISRKEILKSWADVCELNKNHPSAFELFNPDILPITLDPFAGSGTIPLEAQRIGLDVLASDLNPVAVLINRSLLEFPLRFAGRAPVGPAPPKTQDLLADAKSWPFATGLAEDVRRYSNALRERAREELGVLYPDITITNEMASGRPDLTPLIGKSVRVTAWIWARTVQSPNPAFRGVAVPLASNFVLSLKGEGVWVEPVIGADGYLFRVRVGRPKATASRGTKSGRGANFRCVMSDAPISSEYIKSEGNSGRMGARLMAIVAEGERGRIYLDPTSAQEMAAVTESPDWLPDLKISGSTQYLGIKPYGMHTFADLFTARQLLTFESICRLINILREQCHTDAASAGWIDDGVSLADGGKTATAYADAVATYLALVLDRMVFYGSTLCGWLPKDNAMGKSMPQQALAMSWDFAEGNPFSKSSSDILTCAKSVADCIDSLNGTGSATVLQHDARMTPPGGPFIVSTDPPYYDNVPYSDLSDFFYVWLRRALKSLHPALFSTIATPKEGELVAFAHRHEGGKVGAQQFFLEGMTGAMEGLAKEAHPAFPVTIYYAFKQSDTDAEQGTASTGWDTFLDAVIRAGFSISGTWPMRTEGEARMRAAGSNALASSIVLVCRRRSEQAPTTSRRAFQRELNAVLPEALDVMTRGAGPDRSPLAPVDLSQAIIGPGMAIFSKYSAVLEADGTPMSVNTALRLINRFLAEDDFDTDTQFCLHWFEEHGWSEGPFGDADQLARAKGTAVNGVQTAGILQAVAGKVRLLRWAEYSVSWIVSEDQRLPVWEVLHQLIRIFKKQGEAGAGSVLAEVSSKSDQARQLAYRLYTLCERSGWVDDARAYNEIITSWGGIEASAAIFPRAKQSTLFDI